MDAFRRLSGPYRSKTTKYVWKYTNDMGCAGFSLAAMVSATFEGRRVRSVVKQLREFGWFLA